ncbi:hypothetical protein ACP4OV_009770 [Aristida adscensionis]
MASCKPTGLVASALILALLFLSCGEGVEGWCIEVPSPDPGACQAKGGVKNCGAKCEAKGFRGGYCDPTTIPATNCFCLQCADQPPAAPATPRAALRSKPF